MSSEIQTREDVEVDEWESESTCPTCGPSADTKVAGAVRPVVWTCDECEAVWTRETFNRLRG